MSIVKPYMAGDLLKYIMIINYIMCKLFNNKKFFLLLIQVVN